MKFLKEKTAVIVLDMQYDYCSPHGKLVKRYKEDIRPIETMIPKLERFLDKARENSIPVIFTKMTETYEHVGKNMQEKLKSLGDKNVKFCKPGTKGYELVMKKKKGDYVVSKKYYDPFTNPKLKKLLKKLRVKTVIVTGVNTNVCVDSTVKGAFSNGFHVVIPKDLVASPKSSTGAKKWHLKTWDLLFGYVVTSKEILKNWN